MKTKQKTDEKLNVTRQEMLSLVREMIGGYPNPDDAGLSKMCGVSKSKTPTA